MPLRTNRSTIDQGIVPVIVLGLAGFLVLAVVLKNAWICDDAYITFRASCNLVEGRGPTWNTGERVQAFTNPLWMMVYAGAFAVTGESFYTGIALGVVVSTLAVAVVVLKLARSFGHALLALALFACSRAFTDYSTSGLENPLTHLLLALFVLVATRPELAEPRRLVFLSLLGSLAAVNRLDASLLVLPALVAGTRRHGAPTRAVLLGLAPLYLWGLYAIVYYGMPVPNTALVKLNAPFSGVELVVQGLVYLGDSLLRDPVTLIACATGVGLTFRRGISAQRPFALPLAVGALLYLTYVVKIGGGFMSGRFLTAPFFLAVALVAHLPAPELRWGRLATSRAVTLVPIAVALLLAFLPRHGHLLSGSDYGSDRRTLQARRGVSDERARYYPTSSLLVGLSGAPMPAHEWAQAGRRDRERAKSVEDRTAVRTIGTIGFRGFFGGPQVHYVDQLALADPLLARLPPFARSRKIGHYARHVPLGYVASVSSGENRLEDPSLAAFYDQVRLITRGPLFSAERWRAIWSMNTGQLDALVEQYLVRPPRTLTLAEVQAGRFLLVPRSGIRVEMPAVVSPERYRIELDFNDYYEVRYLSGDTELARQRLGPRPGTPMASHDVDVPPGARGGFDAILVSPDLGSGDFLMGRIDL